MILGTGYLHQRDHVTPTTLKMAEKSEDNGGTAAVVPKSGEENNKLTLSDTSPLAGSSASPGSNHTPSPGTPAGVPSTPSGTVLPPWGSPGQRDPSHDLPEVLLQQGWRKFWSKREGRPYFFNKITQQSLWETPPLPSRVRLFYWMFTFE